MSKSIHRAVWEWLKTCPAVSKLSFNYGEEGSHSMILRPSRSVDTEYVNGTKMYDYTVELVVYKPLTFNPNDSGNIDMLESVDDVSEWIRDQVEKDNLPEFPDGYTFCDFTIYENQTEFAIAQDGMFAKYVVPFTIKYLN